MDKEYFRKISSIGIILILLVLLFFLIKPILLSIIVAIILAFLFSPLYEKLAKFLKSKNLSAFLLCILLLTIIFVPIWFFGPTLINQSIKIYFKSQQMDFVTPLQKIFPSLFASEVSSKEIGSAIYSFVTNLTNSIMNSFSDLIRNFPRFFLQSLVAFFVFFIALKEQKTIVNYFKSLLPFSKEIKNELIKSSKEITTSVLYGQIFIGVLQGLLVGIGFFIFKVPNYLFLTIIACLLGVIPIIGTSIVWIPVMIYLIVKGNLSLAIGVACFGLLASGIDTFVKPVIISKKTMLHPALILIGMVGGLSLFGILGVILGPLIIAYLLIILEIYRDKKTPEIFMQKPKLKRNFLNKK